MSYDEAVIGARASSQPKNSVGAFGDKFRQAREKKNLSFDDVSNVTKITARMLQAIEDERFDLLPGGVFNKGFIRAYAKHLGLNDEEAVTDYLACLRQAQIDAHEVWEPATPAAARKAAPAGRSTGAYQKPEMKAHPPVQVEEELPHLQLPRAEDVRPPRREYGGSRDRGIPWSILAVVAVVVVLATVLWIRHSRTTKAEGTGAASTKLAAAQPAPIATAAASNAASGPAPNPGGGSQPGSPAPARRSANTTQASASQPSAKPATVATQNSAAAAAQPRKPTSEEAAVETEAGNDVTREIPPAEPAKPVVKMTLVIRASETSWISITADGQPVTHETLIAPAETSFRASREIVARIGNAGGVSFLFNGQEIPAQGGAAEVKTFVFDAQGMREVPNQPPVQNH